MRARSWMIASLVCSMIASVAAPAPALADDLERVWAVKTTPLRKRPGEAARVIDNADPGDELEVIATRGRWLRVRLGRRVGWVIRTQVEEDEAAAVAAMKADEAGKKKQEKKKAKSVEIEIVDEPAQATAAAPAAAPKSGFSGRIVEDAVKVKIEIDGVRGFDDPRKKTKSVLQLVRGDVVTVIGRGHEGWILVQHENGAIGWIPAASVKDAGRFAGDPRRTPAEAAKVAKAEGATAEGATAEADADAEKPDAAPAGVAKAAGARAPRRSMTAMLVAAGGAQTFQMKQAETKSIATGVIGAVAGGAHVRVRGDLWVGVAAAAEMGSADLTYYGGAEASAAMPTKELVVDASGEIRYGGAGYIAARAGVHYATLSVETDRVEPMLIGERVGGFTVGLAGAYPLGSRFALAGAVDVMPAGEQKMDELPPGTLFASAVRGGWARTTVSMRLPAHLVAAVTYRGGLVSSTLTDGSATPTSATRTDQSHAVLAGVGMSW